MFMSTDILYEQRIRRIVMGAEALKTFKIFVAVKNGVICFTTPH